MKRPKPEDKVQINIRTTRKLKELWTALGEDRELQITDWIREACEHYGVICTEAKAANRTPAEIIALQHGDHVTVDAIVGELELRGWAALSPLERALLMRLDPAVGRRLSGLPARTGS